MLELVWWDTLGLQMTRCALHVLFSSCEETKMCGISELSPQRLITGLVIYRKYVQGSYLGEAFEIQKTVAVSFFSPVSFLSPVYLLKVSLCGKAEF